MHRPIAHRHPCPNLPGLLGAGLLLLAVAVPLATGREIPRPADKPPPLPQLHPGLKPDQVRLLLGPPPRICRQILAHRVLEQWLYDLPQPLCLEFDCPRGEIPQLQTIRPRQPLLR